METKNEMVRIQLQISRANHLAIDLSCRMIHGNHVIICMEFNEDNRKKLLSYHNLISLITISS